MEGQTDLVGPVIQTLLGLGLPGVIIIALGYMVYRLDNRNEKKEEAMREMQVDFVKAQEAATAALNRLSDILLRGKAPE